MDAITADTWLTLGGILFSTVFLVASMVWFFSKIKGEFDLKALALSGEIKLVQNTVGPYAEEIEKSRSRILALTDRVTKLESSNEHNASNIRAVTERLNRIQKV